jgi:hypothetical protein
MLLKRLILLTINLSAFLTGFSQQWKNSDANANNIHNTNTGNVGIRTTNPAFPFQIWDGGTNAYSGIGITPGNNSNENSFISTLKTGGYGVILRAQNSDAGKGQAGIFMRSANGSNLPALVSLTADNIDFRTGKQYTDQITDGNIGQSALYIDHLQRVGIGTTNPGDKLHVQGNTFINGNIRLGAELNGVGSANQLIFNDNGNTDPIWMARYDVASDASELRMNVGDALDANDKFVIGISEGSIWVPKYTFLSDGRLAIGKMNTGGFYKLSVEGRIAAQEVKVTTNSWADYVFARDYNLMSLTSLEAFIKKNNHLPNIPSAQEVKDKEGIELGEMNVKLLEKIEELTLYMIEMNKRMEKLEKENEALKNNKQ